MPGQSAGRYRSRRIKCIGTTGIGARLSETSGAVRGPGSCPDPGSGPRRFWTAVAESGNRRTAPPLWRRAKRGPGPSASAPPEAKAVPPLRSATAVQNATALRSFTMNNPARGGADLKFHAAPKTVGRTILSANPSPSAPSRRASETMMCGRILQGVARGPRFSLIAPVRPHRIM